MTAPRPLSAEITAALRRYQEALHVEYGLADKKCPTADEYYFAGKSCVDARAELDSLLLLADPAPKPARVKKIAEKERDKAVANRQILRAVNPNWATSWEALNDETYLRGEGPCPDKPARVKKCGRCGDTGSVILVASDHRHPGTWGPCSCRVLAAKPPRKLPKRNSDEIKAEIAYLRGEGPCPDKPARSVHDKKWDDAEALRKGLPRKEQKK